MVYTNLFIISIGKFGIQLYIMLQLFSSLDGICILFEQKTETKDVILRYRWDYKGF
ncbi:MAG TPA: hypothetical protein VEY70_20750 [Metabacillus sp.]|nr:hypothetical protein [Metabacillus sp.]